MHRFASAGLPEDREDKCGIAARYWSMLVELARPEHTRLYDYGARETCIASKSQEFSSW